VVVKQLGCDTVDDCVSFTAFCQLVHRCPQRLGVALCVDFMQRLTVLCINFGGGSVEP